MAFIELKKIVERIASRQQLEVLLEDGTPTNITWALPITMINEVGVKPLDLIDDLNDRHWKVEVLALHYIVTPRDDSINDIMGMSWDQVHQHNLRVKKEGKQSKNLFDKL
jgi:hypothetical protein